MRLLLHTCCAVCTVAPLRALEGEGHAATGYFHNPNVHPLIEFRRRLKAQKVLAERLGVPMLYDEDYGLRDFLERVDWRGPGRCRDCYALRLGRTAAVAAECGFEAFTTTLLVSTHQDHELVRRVGEQCAQRQGVPFVYRDWRPLADATRSEAARLNLYHQQYCGCIFSEHERFKDTDRHLYRGGGA